MMKRTNINFRDIGALGGASKFNCPWSVAALDSDPTGIIAFIPVVKFEMAVEGSCGGGIVPDYQTQVDILNKQTELQFIIDLITEKKP